MSSYDSLLPSMLELGSNLGSTTVEAMIVVSTSENKYSVNFRLIDLIFILVN